MKIGHGVSELRGVENFLSKAHGTTGKITYTQTCHVELQVANEIKLLGVVLDRRLAIDKHVLAVTRPRNFHAHAIRHICHLRSTDLAQTLACSLIVRGTGLLQLGTLRRASQQHPEVAACAEQCSQNRPPGTVPKQQMW